MNNNKYIVWIIVILLVIIGLYFWVRKSSAPSTLPIESTATQEYGTSTTATTGTSTFR